MFDTSHYSGLAAYAPPVTLLLHRNPGFSGITDPLPSRQRGAHRPRRALATPWWEAGHRNRPKPAFATGSYASSRPGAASEASVFFASSSPARSLRSLAPAYGDVF
ncbi:hypothetical protein [Mycobacterium leprae]|uniref:hypothetical protein n=1 Tax=Mycobacterium leprae TaxID=1769 RepID=UPI0018D40248|nr:hypothetical protein [Mycobacterium leprae]